MNKTINLLNMGIVSLVLVGCISTGSNKKEQESTTNTNTCEEHEATANKAHNFGARNFHKSYSIPNDLKGAKAQLFLIEKGLKGKPIGSFAVNYKAAEQSYNQSLSAAKVMGCDTSKYPPSPIDAFRKGVKTLEEK